MEEVTRDHLRRRLSLLHAAKALLDNYGGDDPTRKMTPTVDLSDFVRLPDEDVCGSIGINPYDLRIALKRMIEAVEDDLSRREVQDG